MFGATPSNIHTSVEYDPKNHQYIKLTKVGDMVINREYLTFDQYQDWSMEQLVRKYWDDKKTVQDATAGNKEGGLLEKIPGFSEITRKLDALSSIPNIEIKPTGSAEVTLQVVNNYRNDPQVDVNRRSITTFDLDENIQVNMQVKVGDFFNFDLNMNTQATFDFENKKRIKWDGKEDDILQFLELGDVSFPLNTTLIKGSQQLFGAHSKMKFGNLTVDAVVSQKETSTENMRVQGGASTIEFEVRADEYEENRHFFLSQYFYDNYNKALSTLPIIGSNIKIIRIEVWRTNVGATVNNNRNLLAVTDLGERDVHSPGLIPGASTLPNGLTSNNALQLLSSGSVRSINTVTSFMQGLGWTNGTDYEKIESARLLGSNEYTFNSRLGFISLSQPLSSDQMLAVAFQYQVIGDTTVYQVGDMTTDGINDPQVLVVKLLKGSSINTRSPLWRLMMKNVYFLKSTQLSRDNFRFNVLYENPEGGMGIGYFTEGPLEGTPLVEVFGLDRMDASLNYKIPDGVFDWMDSAAFKGGIIQSTTGRVYFPYVEPFGRDLRERLGAELADRYCFDSLYTMTQALAQQYADKNKFYMEGYYTSTVSGEISLGYSVTQGSVTVTAGGVPLIENVDYTVDYTMGTIRIINESILASGTPISVSSENNSFSMTTKSMLGAHFDYEFDPDFHVGFTAMNLREKPMTRKNNFGDEPTSNSIYGVDLNYKHDAPWVTRFMDWLPGIQTKEASTLTLQAEFAHFLPGMANTGATNGTASYIDDFEGAKSSIDLKSPTQWHLASVPQDWNTAMPLFPETRLGTGLAYGYNRARLAWYRIDNIFYESGSPSNITEDDRSRPYARRITEREVFPNKSLMAGESTNIYELNLAYYPDERGPYNYDITPSPFSKGIAADGRLNTPSSRWAGIMRHLDYTDFETQNIETIEFWVMDPFLNPETGEHDDSKRGGKLYFNLGDISEDILRDGRKSFENGLPTGSSVEDFAANPVDTTIWGRVPKMQSIVNAFDNNESARKYQDVGYDGLGSTNGLSDEQSFFGEYLSAIAALYGTASPAYTAALNDPSADDFHYYRSTDYDNQNIKIVERYKYFNNPEGNSAADADNTESYSVKGSSYPNVEDINKDNTLSETENYYQYEIDLVPSKMQIGMNHIVDIQEANDVQLPNGNIAPTCRWYQFSIPIREPDRKVGNINGYQSIRFMRMFLRDFEEPVILRFATLELVYGTWRKYTEELLQPGELPTGLDNNTTFTISTVNIEENGGRSPVSYALPPDMEREQWQGASSGVTYLNEQSLSMDITDLSSGDARAIYRNLSYDLRYYGKLKMYVHAEKKFENDDLDDGDLSLFVRLGSDYTSNYYEYEMPLVLTPWGTMADQPSVIWPQANYVEIDLEKLVDIKTNRNRAIRHGGIEYSSLNLYSETHGGRRYSVLGTPNLGKVKVIMIGIRNPRKQSLDDGNDMLPKSAIVWLNELRLSDYINKGGIAAMALARTNLADVGNLSLYGAYTSSGFGNLEDNLTGVELVNTMNLQSTLNLELGRFLPDDWGIHLPLYFDYNTQHGSPEYNPLDQDVHLSDDIKTYATLSERDSVRRMVQERKTTTNFTLTNIHKDRSPNAKSTKPHFYDVENFSLSYAYSGEKSSDVDMEYYNKKQHRGTLNYAYAVSNLKPFTPFAKVKAFQKKSFRAVKDFNLYYLPKNLSFATEMYRNTEETLLRNKSNALVILRPSALRQFTWRRNYGLQYDLSRSFHIQYDATANARIDEPAGMIDDGTRSDSIWHSILNGGTIQYYQHNISANWDVPISKLPLMDFLRMPLSYRSTYAYQGTTEALASQGSTISNTANFTASLSADFQTLYNKSPLLRKALARPNQNRRQPAKKDNKKEEKTDKKVPLDPQAAALADSLRREHIKEQLQKLAYFGLRMATGVKNITAQYNVSSSAQVAGYMGEPTLVGLDASTQWSPGLPFVMGWKRDIVDELRDEGLLSIDTLMNNPHQNSDNRILNLQASLEPIRDMKISLNASQNRSMREEFYYKYSPASMRVEGPFSYMQSGSYTSTTIILATAFADPDRLFREFLDARMDVAMRLAEMNPGASPDDMVLDTLSGLRFPAGYSGNSQSVLLAAFLATYGGHDAKKYSLSPFLRMPLPGWTVNYTGLSKIPFFKRWFNNVTLSHKYASTYTVGNYYTDPALGAHDDSYDIGSETLFNSAGDYLPPISMDGVQLSEQFNPLIRVNVTMVNSLQFNLSVQKQRSLQLSFSNSQLTESLRSGVTIGAGYRFKDVKITIKSGSKTHNLKSDLVLQLNLTYNNNKTNIRKISQNISQITSGSKMWMGEISAEYQVLSYLTLRAFFQTNINTPWISNTYPNSTTKGGITLRLSF